MSAFGQWPPPARGMARAIDSAVTGARHADADAFGAAVRELSRADREQVATLLGEVSRKLIERAHPDGLDADDAEQLLRSCVRMAAPWYPGLDTDALIRALTGALGIGDSGAVGAGERAGDEAPESCVEAPPDPVAVLAHGMLLVTDLLDAQGLQAGPIVDDALREMRRAQAMELP